MLSNPQAQAQIDFRQGLGLNDNPYPKDSKDYESYMLAMGKMQHEEFKAELQELKNGH